MTRYLANLCSKRKTSSKSQPCPKDDILDGDSKCTCQDNIFHFLCETCNIAICSSCVSGTHKSHTFANLKDSISNLKKKIQKDLQTKLNDAEQNKEEMENGLSSFEKNIQEIENAHAKKTNLIYLHVSLIQSCVISQSKLEQNRFREITENILKEGLKLEKRLLELESTTSEDILKRSLGHLADEI